MARIILSFVAVFWISAAVAQDATETPVDMTGTWRLAGGDIITFDGEHRDHSSITAEMQITQQFRSVFQGTIRWDNRNAPTAREFDHGGDVATIINEEIVGVVGWDNVTVTIVDRLLDASLFEGRLADENTLETIGYEHGDYGFVTRARWVRD